MCHVSFDSTVKCRDCENTNVHIVTYQGASVTNKDVDSDWNLELFVLIIIIANCNNLKQFLQQLLTRTGRSLVFLWEHLDRLFFLV
jgi:hypothetical protein